MHVPAHRGKHHARDILIAALFRDIGFEQVDRHAHRLGGLQHKRELHLARAEELAHILHRRDQNRIYNRKGVPRAPRLLNKSLQPGALPAQDGLTQALLNRQNSSSGLLRTYVFLFFWTLKNFHKPAERVLARIMNQRKRRLARILRDLVRRQNIRRVHYRHIQPGRERLAQKNGIQNLARARRQPERNIREPQNSQHPGQLGLYAAHRLQGRDRAPARIGIAAGERKGQHIENEIPGREANARHRDLVDAFRHLNFFIGGFRHAVGFIDHQRDQRRAMALREPADLFGVGLARLQIDAVNNRSAAV